MARDIRVVITGDAADLIKAAAEGGAALHVLNDEADKGNKHFLTLGRAIKYGIPAIAGIGLAALAATGHMSMLVSAFSSLAPLIPVLTVLLAGFLAPFTTLAAILVAFVPPLTLIAGLLGALGAAFYFAGERALKGGGALSQVARGVAQLTKMFNQTATVLANLFLPYFMQLIGAAKDALRYIDQLSHMSLDQAFHSLATRGVRMLTSFLEQVGHVIGKPIRLAFDIAFGQGAGGSTIRNSMLSIWTQIVNFFEKPPSTGGPSIASMIGSWFGRQDFTGVGMRWAMEIAGAFIDSLGLAIKKAWATRGGKMIMGGALGGAAIGTAIAPGGGTLIGTGIGAAAGIALNRYWPKIAATAKTLWHDLESAARTAWDAIGKALLEAVGPTTWHNIQAIGRDVFSILRSLGTTAFHLIETAARIVWQILRTIWIVVNDIVIKTGLWKVAVGLLRGAFEVVIGVVRLIADAIRYVITKADSLVSTVANDVAGAWGNVLGIVQSIAGAIQTAIGAAQSLVNALGSGSFTSGGDQRGGQEAGRGYHLRRAAGGPVSALTSYLVGEAGPELFIPRAAGTIIPNSRLGGGGDLHVHFQGQPLLSKRDVQQAIATALIEYTNRGGSFSSFGNRRLSVTTG